MSSVNRKTGTQKHLVTEPVTWTEDLAVGGRQLMGLIERLVAKGNIRRLRVLKPSGQVLFETSLTTGVTVAGVFTVLAPMLTALGALAALFTEFRVRIVYVGNPPRG